jgi:hypothetical protein
LPRRFQDAWIVPCEAAVGGQPTLFILGDRSSWEREHAGFVAGPAVLRAPAAAVRGSKTAIIANAPHHMIRQEPVGTSNLVLEVLVG